MLVSVAEDSQLKTEALSVRSGRSRKWQVVHSSSTLYSYRLWTESCGERDGRGHRGVLQSAWAPIAPAFDHAMPNRWRRPMSLLGSFLRRAALVAFGLSAHSLLLRAQSMGTVSGRVIDTQGGPLQGATVSLAGTTRGAIVRSDGSYRLTAPAGRYQIR